MPRGGGVLLRGLFGIHFGDHFGVHFWSIGGYLLGSFWGAFSDQNWGEEDTVEMVSSDVVHINLDYILQYYIILCFIMLCCVRLG